eukprot:1995791-Ditylum_brightwellii.AAC.1
MATKENLEKAKTVFKDYKLKLKEEFRYLGRFIGFANLAEKNVQEKVEGWVDLVEMFSNIMLNQPQAAFSGYTHSLQFEWAYIQNAIEVEERFFEPVEEAVNSHLLPALFDAHKIPSDLCNLTSLPAKMGGQGALHPCRKAVSNLATSKDSTSHLVDAILGQTDFDPQAHAATMETGKASSKKQKEEMYCQVISNL